MASSSNDEWLKGLGLGKRARTRGQIKETGDDSVWLTSLEVVDNFRRSVSAHDKRRRQPKEETLEPAPSSEIGAEDKTTTSPGAAEESSVQTADRTEAAEGASLANFDAPVSEKAKKKRGKAKRKSSEKEPTEQPMADSPKVPIVAAPSPVPECGEGEEESGVNPVVVQQKTAKEKKSAKKKRRDQVEVLPGDMQNPSGQLPAPTAKVVSPPQAAVQQPEEEPKAPSAKEAAEQPRRRSRSDLAVISQAKLEDLEEDEGEGDEGGAHRRKRSLRSGRKSGNEATKEEEEAPEAEVAAVAASVSSGAGQPPQPRRSGGGGSTASGGGGARRKKENAGGGNASSSNAGGAGEVQDPWVLCDKCKKWRKLPSHVSLVHLPKRWFCHMNEWDAKRSNCDAEEESWEDQAAQKQQPHPPPQQRPSETGTWHACGHRSRPRARPKKVEFLAPPSAEALAIEEAQVAELEALEEKQFEAAMSLSCLVQSASEWLTIGDAIVEILKDGERPKQEVKTQLPDLTEKKFNQIVMKLCGAGILMTLGEEMIAVVPESDENDLEA